MTRPDTTRAYKPYTPMKVTYCNVCKAKITTYAQQVEHIYRHQNFKKVLDGQNLMDKFF